MKDKTKGLQKFSQRMQKKLVVLFLFVLLAFVGLSVKLFMINRDKGEQYKKQVLSQQQYDSTTLPFRRGDIIDSKGTSLATSEKIYNVVLDSKIVNSGTKGEYIEPTVQALLSCFELVENDLRTFIAENPASQYHVLLKGLTFDEIADFQAMQLENTDIRGIWFEEEYRRVYPNGTLASDIIGFTGKDNVGTYGLEAFYNDTLNGTNGREYGYLNGDSTLERTTKAAVDGYTLVSTIDANVQSIVEKHILAFNKEHENEAREGNGSNNTGVIIMEVDSGEILAMASYPTFNLNDPRNPENLIGSKMVEEITNASGYQEVKVTDTVINQEVLETMSDDEIYVNLNSLWRNFCISDTFEPGSTQKPFTIAAGLDAGKMTGHETYNCTGYLMVGDYKIKCHSLYGEGVLTVGEALEQSCNVALMHMGQAIGEDIFLKYQSIFNFGLRTNIDLAGEARTDSLVFNKDTMGVTELATSTFGQGFNVTMIEMIASFCSLINGGYYYEPHMVNRIQSSDGAVIENIEPRIIKQTISEETSRMIREYCYGVVENGTGKTARPAGYSIGGKTGTAETAPRGTKDYVVSFLGYAPANDPQIAIYTVIDRPNVEVQDNARFATILCKDILTEVLPYLNIFMTEELSEEEQAELAVQKQPVTSPEDASKEEGSNDGEGESQGGDEGTGTSEEGDTGETPSDGEEGESEPVYVLDLETLQYINRETGEVLQDTESVIQKIDPNAPEETQPNSEEGQSNPGE